MVSMLRSIYYSARLLSRHQGTFAGLDHGFFIAHHSYVTCFSQTHYYVLRRLQEERRESEESSYHPTTAGRIFKIIATRFGHKYVIMEAFDVSGSRDGRYGMPTMCANPGYGYQTIPPSVSSSYLQLKLTLITTRQDISFIFNAQHDCEGGKCGYGTGTYNGGQTTAKRTIIHSTHDRFFINLHALHNAWRLREVLPRNLTEPTPYITDREEFHHMMARKLQKNNPQKRAKAKEKAKDTRAQKKRTNELGQGSGDEKSGGER